MKTARQELYEQRLRQYLAGTIVWLRLFLEVLPLLVASKPDERSKKRGSPSGAIASYMNLILSLSSTRHDSRPVA